MIPQDLTLRDAWNHSSGPFGDWVLGVSEAYGQSHLSIEPAARMLSTTPAELEAALRLATLDDDELHRFGESRPPKTTWFIIADSSTEAVQAVAEYLKAQEGSVTSARVVAVIRSIDGAPILDRIAQIDADVFTHLAAKATQYGALTPRNRNALKSFGTRKRGGRPLTVRQVGFAQNLLDQLADEDVVTRDSPDGDQETCDLVLDALGR